MITRLLNKKAVLICAALSFAAGMFIFLSRYDFYFADPAANNFAYLHDGDITGFDFYLLLSVINAVLLFPFAADIISYKKSANEIYIVPRMANSAKFYYIKFLQLVFLCLVHSFIYNGSILAFYCAFGGGSESAARLAAMFFYAAFADFAVELVFAALLQLAQTTADIKAALIFVITVFLLCTFAGLRLPAGAAKYWITNFYFVTPAFADAQPLPAPFEVSPAAALICVPAAMAFAAAGSIIYKRKDHI